MLLFKVSLNFQCSNFQCSYFQCSRQDGTIGLQKALQTYHFLDPTNTS